MSAVFNPTLTAAPLPNTETSTTDEKKTVVLAAPETAAAKEAGDQPPAVPPVVPVSGSADYLKMLQQYMTAMMLALATLTRIQAQLSQQQNQVQQTMNNLAAKQVDKAKDDLKKVQEAIEKAKHAGLFSRILGDILGGLMAAIGLATANPALFLAGGTMVAMQESGANEKLQQALASLPGGEIWGNVLIALGMAVVSAGAASVLAAAPKAAAAGATAAAEAAASSGSAAAAQASGSGASAAASGAGSGAAAGAQSLGKTIFLRTLEFTALFNPYNKIAKETVGRINESAAIGVGMALTIAVAGAAAKYDASFMGTASKANLAPASAISIMQKMSIAMGVAQSGAGIWGGVAKLQLADAQEQQGETNAQITFYQALTDILGSLQQSSLQSNKTVTGHMSHMLGRTNQFVSLWSNTAEMMA